MIESKKRKRLIKMIILASTTNTIIWSVEQKCRLNVLYQIADFIEVFMRYLNICLSHYTY